MNYSATSDKFDSQNVRPSKFLSHFLHSVYNTSLKCYPGLEKNLDLKYCTGFLKQNAYLLSSIMGALAFHREITVVLFKTQSSWVSWDIGSIVFHTIIWGDIVLKRYVYLKEYFNANFIFNKLKYILHFSLYFNILYFIIFYIYIHFFPSILFMRSPFAFSV